MWGLAHWRQAIMEAEQLNVIEHLTQDLDERIQALRRYL